MRSSLHSRKTTIFSLVRMLRTDVYHSLAVKYFFLTTDGDSENADLCVDSFNAVEEQNDYEVRPFYAHCQPGRAVTRRLSDRFLGHFVT